MLPSDPGGRRPDREKASTLSDSAPTSMPETPSIGVHLDRLPTDADLGRLQFTTLLYYLQATNPDNGLVRDKTEPTCPGKHRGDRDGAGDTSGGGGTRRADPRICGEDRPQAIAIPVGAAAGGRAGCVRLQGLLLPFS